jgi:molybdate transport repressor ModE-like protein
MKGGARLQEHLWATFKAVAEAGSISKAARQLNLSQSAVSQQVQQLEDEYGAELLTRTTQGVVLTAAGELLYRYANRIVRTVQESRDAVSALSSAVHQELRIGASFTLAEYLLPSWLSKMWGPTQETRLSVMMANSAAVLEQVVQRAVHVGLIEADLRHPQLVQRRLQDDQLKAVVPRGHRWWGSASVPLDEFLAEPLILREPGSGTRAALEEALDEVGLGLDMVHVRLVLGTTQAIKSMVSSGLGITVLSPLTIPQSEREQFHLLDIDGLVIRRHFSVIYPRDLAHPAAHRFVDTLLRWS